MLVYSRVALMYALLPINLTNKNHLFPTIIGVLVKA